MHDNDRAQQSDQLFTALLCDGELLTGEVLGPALEAICRSQAALGSALVPYESNPPTLKKRN